MIRNRWTPLLLAFVLAACSGCGAGPGEGDGSGGESEFTETSCDERSIKAAPSCTPTCDPLRFHVEFERVDSSSPSFVLFRDDGGAYVGRSGIGDAVGRVEVLKLSPTGEVSATYTTDPCPADTPPQVQDLVLDGAGGLYLGSSCKDDLTGITVEIRRLDGDLNPSEEQEFTYGPGELLGEVVRLAVLDGSLAMHSVRIEGTIMEDLSRAVIRIGIGTPQEKEIELYQELIIIPGELRAEGGHLLLRLSEISSMQEPTIESCVFVLNGAGEIIMTLTGGRYVERDLEYEPGTVHLIGDDLIIAGRGNADVVDGAGEAAREVFVERRSLDGALQAQTRFLVKSTMSLRDLIPVGDDPARADDPGYLLVLRDKLFSPSTDGEGAQVKSLPVVTWLDSDLEHRFTNLPLPGMGEIPGPVVPTCDCGYLAAWNEGAMIHVARTNNLLEITPHASCDDGLACTSEADVGGVCTLEVMGGCLSIDGCHQADDPYPGEPCIICGVTDECGEHWRVLKDGSTCGGLGICEDERCVCQDRWVATFGKPMDDTRVMALGLGSDGTMTVVARTVGIGSGKKTHRRIILDRAGTETPESGPLPTHLGDITAALVDGDRLILATDGDDEEIHLLDPTGAVIWSRKTTFRPTALRETGDGNVLAYRLEAGPELVEMDLLELSVEHGDVLSETSWSVDVPQLSGSVEIMSTSSPWYGPRVFLIPGEDRTINLITVVEHFSEGSDIGGAHVVRVETDLDSEATSLDLFEHTWFEIAAPWGTGGFISCRGMEVSRWTLDGEVTGTWSVEVQDAPGENITRECRDIAAVSEDELLLIVEARNKTTHLKSGEVIRYHLNEGIVRVTPVPFEPDGPGLSLLDDGGWAATGRMQSSIRGIARADDEDRYQCW